MKRTAILRTVGLLAVAPLYAVSGGCGGDQPTSLTGLSSFQVTMVSPTADKLGTPGAPVDLSSLTIDVDAIDVHGQPWPSDEDVDVYLSFAGNKIGRLTNCGNHEDEVPLTTIHLTGGRVKNQKIAIPHAYGVSTLWLEQNPTSKADAVRSYATGTTPRIYFANPTIPEVQTPLDLNAPEATYCSQFNGKHVVIDHATGKGRLVVTSVFINAFAVADTGANYDPAIPKSGFNHMYIFAFGRPPDAIVPGRIMTDFEGNISKFVGFSELNFPLQNYADTVDPTLMPKVVVLAGADRPAGQAQNIKLASLSAATVQLTGHLCPIDQNGSDWKKYNQFTLDLGNPSSCDPFTTFSVGLPGKSLGTFNPVDTTKYTYGPMGTLVSVTGMLENKSGQNEVAQPPVTCQTDADCVAAMFATATCVEATCKKGAYNFWTVYPREASDIKVH